MKTNPGAPIAPSQVIGRDRLIENLWRTLERQSLVLSAERRMGKTSVIKKMQAEAPPDLLPIYRDLEHVRSPLEFVQAVLQDVEEYVSKLRQNAGRARKLVSQLGGTEVAGIIKLPSVAAPHWKSLLEETIRDLVENQEKKVILFWDEMPYMLGNIGDEAAMEVLDTLRSLRQTHTEELRMVFSGSIGLHHAIEKLRESGYANSPINDMYIEDLPPLSDKKARELAYRLLTGEGVSTSSNQKIAEAIAKAVDNIPYYIHHLIARLALHPKVVDEATVRKMVDATLSDPNNRWYMSHYRDRIDTYYDDEKRPYALVMLDILAVAEKPLLFKELLERVKSETGSGDREIALTVFQLLQQDYYIIQRPNGQIFFRYPLIQRYWQLSRGLTA
ncbi:MAG: ATP-binding protein [Oscillatoria sp. SIO1A7]|nr:ATP-binding protein [Oscillatoria sp. SIO1A7]